MTKVSIAVNIYKGKMLSRHSIVITFPRYICWSYLVSHKTFISRGNETNHAANN